MSEAEDSAVMQSVEGAGELASAAAEGAAALGELEAAKGTTLESEERPAADDDAAARPGEEAEVSASGGEAAPETEAGAEDGHVQGDGAEGAAEPAAAVGEGSVADEEEIDAQMSLEEVTDPEQVAAKGIDSATGEDGPDEQRAAAAENRAGEVFSGLVTFVVQPEGFRTSEQCSLDMPMRLVAQKLEQRLSIPATSLRFSLPDGRPLGLDETLAGPAESMGDALEVFVIVAAEEVEPEPAYNGAPPPAAERVVRLPDGGFLLRVDCGERGIVSVTVEPSYRHNRKPFLGGYKHKNTGREYHHAASQMERKPAPPRVQRFARDTQTVQQASRSVLTAREAATQVARPGIFIDDADDVAISPGPYTTSERWHARRVEACVVLQRHARGLAARRVARVLADAARERADFAAAAAEAKEEADAAAAQDALMRRLRPRTKADFARLQKELQAWRDNEAQKIAAADLDPPAAAAARIALLNKETRLLGTLDRLRSAAQQEAAEAAREDELAKLAAPKRWACGQATMVEVHTPETARAGQLVALYRALRTPTGDDADRLEALRAMQRVAAQFDCMLTRDLLDLSAREADLIARGRPPAALQPLRRRISNLFLQFMETEAFNAQAKILHVAPSGFC